MDTANDNGMFCVDRSPESDDYCQVSALGLEKLLLNPPQNETGFHNETSTEIAVPAPFNSEDMIDPKLAMDEASSCISEILFPENYIPNILMEANNTELPHITQSEVQQSLATNGNQPQDILLANSQSVTQYMDTNEEFTIPMTQGSSQSTEAPILTQDSINMAVLETNNVKSVLSFSQNYQIIDVSKRQPSIKKPASEAAIMKEIKDIHRNIEKSLSKTGLFY